MKRAVVTLVVAILILGGCKTQDPAVKAANKIEQDALFESAVQAVNDHRFVLEADRIIFKNGQSAFVNSNTNFISLHDDKASIQMAFNSPYAGPNGIGGITLDGTASNIKIKTDKKGNIIFSMNVLGTGISANVSFTMARGSNQVSATVMPNFNSRRITFTGDLYPEAESNVFKGRAL